MAKLLPAVIAGALGFFGTLALAGAAEDPEPGLSRPAHDADPSWQVNSTLSGRAYSLKNATPSLSATPSPSIDGVAEQFDVALISFFAPLRDDGSPYSLRPFLQRTSRWSLTLGGGHFSTHNPFGGPDRTDWNGGVAGGVDAYVKPWLALTGGLSYRYEVLHDVDLDQSTHSFDGSVGIGLRAANTRFDASYAFIAHDVAGSFTPVRQLFSLSAFTAIARRFTINLSGTVIPSGAEGDLSLEYYAMRDLGIFAGAFAGKGNLYSDDASVRRYVGRAGLAGWIDPTFGILGEYALTIEDVTWPVAFPSVAGYHEVAHAITFELYMRFDQL